MKLTITLKSLIVIIKMTGGGLIALFWTQKKNNYNLTTSKVIVILVIMMFKGITTPGARRIFFLGGFCSRISGSVTSGRRLTQLSYNSTRLKSYLGGKK